MINFLLKIKLLRKCKTFPTSNGMTYVELIVVLGIFAVMSSIIMYNYGEFQAKVDIKNLASDIALKIVEAQKSALSGKWSSGAPVDWKPSYGVYFNIANPGGDKSFVYFNDFDDNGYTGSEAIETVSITTNNYILEVNGCTNTCTSVSPLSITFKRPDSGAIFNSGGVMLTVDYIQITIKSSRSTTIATIKIYPSGRVQVN